MSIAQQDLFSASWPNFDYPFGGAGYDEFCSGPGVIRPHWTELASELQKLGPSEFRRRSEMGRRLVQEQGITYVVYGDAQGMERPWQLDPMPLMMAPEEWQKIERGLVQRATLINAILADTYGPQALLRSGWLPPALVLGQPDFLRAAHGIKPPHGTFLHFYAADLARSPDGQWWVISDRSQIPTGAGYALANRLVTSRILPEAFRDCRVHRLASFFREVQRSLARLTLRRTEEPRVVVLTPGPFNETYFEQAYLARYLGYSLVEGQDLTVRDGRVFLKTLSGLEPVDVILRRVDDDFCDPLALRNDSILGVPGLVEALRAGNVAVANALGCGILQSPGFKAFLPGLCRHVLGEELLLPSIATWWCGQKEAEVHVLSRLDELNVKPALRLPAESGVEKLTSAELAERIRFQPHHWSAQERMTPSTVPTWDGGRLVPRPLLLRVYLVATEHGYHVMPGGLARAGAALDAPDASMQRGGTSKDVWVVSPAPVEDVSLLHSSSTAELRRVGNNLPSRLADNFFWLGRYAERVDATARLLRTALSRFNPEAAMDPRDCIHPLIETLQVQGQLSESAADGAPQALEAELLAAVFDAHRPASLRALTGKVQRLAFFVRDRTSADVWRALHQFAESISTASSPVLAQDALGAINRLLLNVASFYGFARENMTRAQGWRFIDIGQRIERAIYLCTLLDCALRSEDPENPSLLEALLDVADSTLTYRSRYSLIPSISTVYDLVLLDETNPRSLIFQLLQLVKHFDRLPREPRAALPSEGQRILIQIVARARLLDPREMARNKWAESETAAVLRECLESLPSLAEAIAVNYFAHSTISRA